MSIPPACIASLSVDNSVGKRLVAGRMGRLRVALRLPLKS